ncbi:MAG: cardiolipin synthase [Candidatus Omnitrophica bacterium]|nr:cardiolipin synthase [Candidatus Omnitrophota bacterium]
MMGILPLIVIAFQVYIIFTVIVLLLDNRDPSETFAWIFIFILLPIAGFALYLFAGRNWKKSYDHKRKLPQYVAKNLITLFKPIAEVQEKLIKLMNNRSKLQHNDLMTLLYRNSNSLLTVDNSVKVYHRGKEKFEDLLKDIQQAKNFIHLQYFIWYSNDILGKKLKKLLIEKVKEGVEVKILYDYSGCFFTLGRGYIRSLRKAGILIYPFFNYLAVFKTHTFNYRNHRKIAVIDGKIAYSGGMNVGQEVIDGGKKYKSWRDTHVRFKGDSVNILNAIFAIDWYNTVPKEDIFEKKYFPNLPEKLELNGDLPIQFPTSGYDSPWPAILQLYFSFITMAEKNITIVSPYFIPESSLLVALKTAAMRGIKVTVLMAGIHDNPIPYWAAFSYFEELLKAGVQIFQYQKGFMHAKILSCDGRMCSIGTANFDIRSLRLNYEVNAVFYDEKLTKEIDQQITKDLDNSREVTLADFNQISIIIRLRNSLMRLFSALL